MKFCYVNENNILLFTIYSVYTCITNFNEQYFFDDYALVVLIFLSVRVCIKFSSIIKQCHHLGIDRRLGIYSISPLPSTFDSEASRRGRPRDRGCRSGAGTGSWSSCHRDGTRTRAWSCRYCSEAGFRCSKLSACRYWGNHCPPSIIRKVPLAST